MQKNIRRPLGAFNPAKTADTVKTYNIDKLIKEHPAPQVWLDHLQNDLMKFWGTETARTLDKGLFHTYRSNSGLLIPDDPQQYPAEIKAALANDDTKGLIDLDHNYVRAHSRQTFAYGIAFNMTGESKYLEWCRTGADALMNAFDNENGMFTRQNNQTGEWGDDINQRTCQDLAYGITGIGMYYYLTRDERALFRIIQAQSYIFDNYFSHGRGFFTWLPKDSLEEEKNRVEIVAQLDQIYAYMMWLAPALPEPYKSDWSNWLKKIAYTLITRFYSERYGFFWGAESETAIANLGTDHTDFGHSVKTMWLIYEIGIFTGEIALVNFARGKISTILEHAFLEENGSWARRFTIDGELDKDKEWWGLAELDQACAILSLNDPSYLEYLNKTYQYWFDYMVDKENGEIWHMVSAADNKPVLEYPKIHSWKTSLHSFEHCLFGYLTASQIKNKEFTLHYAFKSEQDVTYDRVHPYLFRANITNVREGEKFAFMENGNRKISVSFYSLH